MAAEEHQEAPARLQEVREKHDPALRHRVGEKAHPGGEQHVTHDEEELQQRSHPLRRADRSEQRDGGDEQGIVGERREKLRRHDGVKTTIHLNMS